MSVNAHCCKKAAYASYHTQSKSVYWFKSIQMENIRVKTFFFLFANTNESFFIISSDGLECLRVLTCTFENENEAWED